MVDTPLVFERIAKKEINVRYSWNQFIINQEQIKDNLLF